MRTLGGADLGSGCRSSEDLTTPSFLVKSRTETLGKTGWEPGCQAAGICNAKDLVCNWGIPSLGLLAGGRCR